MNSLAKLHYDRAEKAYFDGDFKTAITECEKTVELVDKVKEPEDFAMLHINFGNSLCQMPTGDKSNNLERAIKCYEAALEIRTKKDYPLQFAMTQNYLGLVYVDLPLGNRIENIENAIKHHEQASEGYAAVNLTHEVEEQQKKIAALKILLKLETEKIIAEQAGDAKTAEQSKERGEMTSAVTKICAVLLSFGESSDEREKNILGEIRKNTAEQEAFLKKPRTLMPAQSELVILRRFNSYTPILSFGAHQSRGGGYFLICEGKGVVIDPGFNFIQNFFEAGFVAADIDAIMITHAHNDHTVDLESLVTLLYKRNKMKDIRAKNKIHLYLNRTAAVKYGAWLDLKRDVFLDIHVMNPGDNERKIVNNLMMKPIEAEHEDIVSGDGALGFLFTWNKRRIFFTGDSACSTDYLERCKKLKPVDLFIPHLGTVEESEFDFAADSTFKLEKHRLENHLGFLGVMHLIQRLEPGLTLISEFGEEMKGKVRKIIAQKITETIGHPTLAADVEMRVRLKDNHIRCCHEKCGKYVPFDKIYTGFYPGDPEINTLYYRCITHDFDDVHAALNKKFKKRSSV